LEYSAAAQPGGALDAVKRGGADAASLLAAQVTLIVSQRIGAICLNVMSFILQA
jgi:hypothetical protein